MGELEKITEKGKNNMLTKKQLKRKYNRTKTVNINKEMEKLERSKR